MVKNKMRPEKVSAWCNMLVTNRQLPFSNEEIAAIWAPISEDLQEEEQISLLRCLIEKDSVFKWLYLISHCLPNIFSDYDYFINLIEEVIDKIKNDMAQGIFIRSLINIGEKNPEKALGLYSQIIAVSNEMTTRYSGLILGGIAKKRFTETIGLIERGLKEDTPPIKVACLKAVRVVFENEIALEFPSNILDIMENLCAIEDPYLQSELINAYIDFDKFEPQRCEKKLLEIATNGDSSDRYTIASSLWLRNLKDQKTEIEILKICSDDDSSAVLEMVVRALSNKGDAFFEDSLVITKKILTAPNFSYGPMIMYYIKELCKKNPKKCLEEFEEWIKFEDNPILQFRISEISAELQKKDAS